MEQKAFVIDARDNVATALTEIAPGAVHLLGEAASGLSAVMPVPKGHKLALRDIAPGEAVVKYGVVIGRATESVPLGAWVHLHNIRSVYDERSSHLDIKTGAPEDTVYE